MKGLAWGHPAGLRVGRNTVSTQVDAERTLPTSYSSADGIFDFPDASLLVDLSTATVSCVGAPTVPAIPPTDPLYLEG